MSRVRCFSAEQETRKGGDSQAPAHSVHADLTTAGALNALNNYTKDPAESERLLQGHVQFINVWRPLKPIRKDPLAILDYTSVDDKADFQKCKIISSDTQWAELHKLRFSESHRWFYLHGQTQEEPLVFNQWDSRSDRAMTVPHSAFEDPRYVNCDARESVEIKMWAFTPQENI
jgi:hypothetical protein